MKKIFCFDTETTGLDSKIHDVVQIAGLMIIDGEIVDETNIFLRPLSPGTVSTRALEIQGTSFDVVMSYCHANFGYGNLINFLKKYIGQYDSKDKAYPMGFNVKFDLDMLTGFFDKMNDKYLGSWFNWRSLDPLYILRWLDYHEKISLDSYTLEKVASYFGIELKAHDALSDCRATFEIWKRLNEFII